MFPVLIQIGPVTLYTYGLLVGAAFLTGISLAYSRAQKEGIAPDDALDFGFYIVIGAIIGSRALYVVISYDYFMENPLQVFSIWNGGLVFYGGFIGAAISGFLFVKKRKLDPWKMADLAAPSIALGHAIGRFGCLAAGSCYGKPTDSWLGITFTDPLAIAPLGISLYPTQIFDSINELLIFFILIAVRPKKMFDGQLFLLWIMLYAVGRFIVEIYRGDDIRGFIIQDAISVSQGLAIVVFAVSALAMLIAVLRDKQRKAAQQAEA